MPKETYKLREKVLKGLDCCKRSGQNIRPKLCDECPYKDEDIMNSRTVWETCINVLASDAYWLLRSDEAMFQKHYEQGRYDEAHKDDGTIMQTFSPD